MTKRRFASLVTFVLAHAAAAEGLGPYPQQQPTTGSGWVDRSGFGESIYRAGLEGAIVGGLIGVALTDPSDPATATRVVLGALLGTAGGAAVPLLLNQGEVRTGDVVFIGVGQGWGLAHGFMVPLAFQINQCLGGAACDLNVGGTFLRIDAAVAAGLSLAGGLGASMLAPALNFTPGQAEGIGSAALWGGWAGFLLVNAFAPPNTPPEVVIASILGGGDAGMLAAWYFRDFFDMDRSRVGALDLGIIVGSGFGLGMAWFITPRLDSPVLLNLSMLGGAVLGLAVAYYATNGLDGYKRRAPATGGAMAALASFDGRRWSLGAPAPRPVVSLVRGAHSVGIGLDLLGGTF